MSERGDFRCDDCGLTLRNVVLPVRHVCRGGKKKRSESTTSREAKTESSFVYRGGKPNCAHFGEETGVVVRCACPASEMVPIYHCGLNGTTTTVPVRPCNLHRAIEADGRGLAIPATNCRECKMITPPLAG